VITFYPKKLVHFVRTHGAARGTIDNEIGIGDDGSQVLTFRFRICLDGVKDGSTEEIEFGEKMTEEYLDAVRTTLAAVRARVAASSPTTKPRGRSAAITGAGGGLGRQVALQLWKLGYQVFGTARRSSDVDEVEAASGGAVKLTICDVTDEAAVNSWVNSVSSEVGSSGLDVLVSNAGILTVGPLETISLDRVRQAFEVNVFGSLAVINAFLPALRAAKGRIIQVGSMTGTFPVPFAGPACASKAALESFAAVYRCELKQFGIDFIMIRPGNMRTGGPDKATSDLEAAEKGLTAEQRRLYGVEFGAASRALDAMQHKGIEAAEAAEAVIDAIQQTPAPIGVPVGPEAKEILKLVRERTDAELDAMRREFLGLDA
jgi:NAD(P)-dependent dehydrogenase (short-subunit alcohol dehydrogenase family)